MPTVSQREPHQELRQCHGYRKQEALFLLPWGEDPSSHLECGGLPMVPHVGKTGDRANGANVYAGICKSGVDRLCGVADANGGQEAYSRKRG